jgi:TPR repeat protein
MKLFSRLSIVLTILCGILALTGCVSTKSRYLTKAERGDGQAQGIIGSMYLTGNGSVINYQHAYYWLRHGAASGDSIARYYLGVMYQYGLGKVIPDQMRADRHYKSVYKNVHSRAKKGELLYINILAEMYYYGRGIKQNKKEALKMFKYCAKRQWQPAIENLGVILFTDEETGKNLRKAKSLLLEATKHNYPRAQFYLAEYYFNQEKNKPAMAHLQHSVEGGFPPAMVRLAEKYLYSAPNEAKKLFEAAANEGYAPAMLVVADSFSQTDDKLKWIKKAAEHSSVPAMLQYAQLLKEQIVPAPTKEMILYQLALKIKKNDPEIEKLILELDNKTGLFFPIKYTWENIYGGENILLANSEINRVMQGFKAGIRSGSQKLFQERLTYNPLPFFMNNDWYQLYENNLPALWTALLFKRVEKHEAENAGFWIGYGISAGLAGQGTCQAFAAFKLNELVKKRAKHSKNNSLMNIAALMKANALILLHHDAEAYASLFNNGNLMRDDLPYLINFINFWCKPLLKDKRKFSIATGIDAKKFGKFSFPSKKDFYDLEYGRIVSEKSKIPEPQIDINYFKQNKFK